ncbi:MAG TPA: nucleoside recognition protein [Syntrophomonas sp.]|nr:nucleoside recognition protein [Syntrophomonas sp.]
MSFITAASTVLKSSFLLVGQLALIITAIMIMVEFFQEYNILNKLTALLSPFTRLLGMSSEANLPLMAGLLLGIGYGGAIILDSTRQGKLSSQDIYLVNLFLVLCHSLIEDTLIWAALGAMVVPIQIGRFILALGVCYLVSRFLSRY